MKCCSDQIKNIMSGKHARMIFFMIALAFSIFHFSFSTVLAQDDLELAPPPIMTVTKDERAKLASITDVKARTKLVLELMDMHLMAAEQLNTNADFDGVFRELGGFQGLLEDSLDYLDKQNSNSNKVLDNFKRMEIGLRGFTPRIEVIHRDLPFRYEDYVRRLLHYVRDARSRAVDPLFSDKVVQIKNTR